MAYRHHRSPRQRRTRFFWIGVSVGVVIILATLFSVLFFLTGGHGGNRGVATYKASVPPPPPDWSNYFASTTLQAKAVYVVDLTNGQVLFSKNANDPLPLASITKLMTAATALDTVPTSTIVEVTKSAIAEGWNGLYVDERWRLGDLLRFTLVVSSNGGATAVAQNVGAILQNPDTIASQAHLETASSSPASIPDAAVLISEASSTGLQSYQATFVQKMNVLAGTLGLSSARFFNPSGLDIDTLSAGAYASAEDVSKLLIYMASTYPDIMNATRFPSITVSSLNKISHTVNNTDILSLQGLDLLASKTGYTDLAGGNLAIIVDIDNHPVVIVALGSTEDARFTDVAALASSSAAVIAAGG